jgi:hypothetical protein
MSAKESLLNLRKSNFNFGNESLKYETTYNSKYDRGLDNDYLNNKKDEAQISSRKTNIRIESI